MCKSVLWLFCATILSTQAALSMWEFAVTTDSKIYFYDEDWKEITAAAHQFEKLSAIAFDETEEIIYFNDQQLKHNGSIFSLKLSTDADLMASSHAIEKVVLRTTNETISSIAYDPLNRNLFWIDTVKRAILFKSIDDDVATPPKVLIDFAKDKTKPDSIAIDICRRKLYWTNSNPEHPTVERMDLDGTQREVIVSDDLHRPHGIVVDQLSDRIYWVVDLPGIHFKVESANLDGTDRTIVYKGLDITPFNLAVTRNKIFWTGSSDNNVWSYPKLLATNHNETEAAQIKAVRPNSTDNPRGIVARTGFFSNLQNDQHCASVVTKIKSRLLTPKPTKSPVDVRIKKMRQEWCLNGGEYSESDTCVCQMGFKGLRCEISECHNFCVHGTCAMSEFGFPACTCQKGFYGTRCQLERCLGYCLNEGTCKLDGEGVPSCYCPDNFGGERCAQKLEDIVPATPALSQCKPNSTEICTGLCEVFKYALTTNSCQEFCHDLELSEEESADIEIYARMLQKYTRTGTDLQECRNTWNGTVVIVLVCGVVSCLGIVLLIITGLRRFYKPARPRIKKTFVVRKQASSSSDTPLTNRPMATEQCEITIENCCNMNICDTPCFDPKLVQATLARNDNLKEDKKMLVHSMEDDLY